MNFSLADKKKSWKKGAAQVTSRGICSKKCTLLFLSTKQHSICQLRGSTNSKFWVLNSPLKRDKVRPNFPNPCSCIASNLNVVGDVFSEGHVEHDQRFSRHGCVGEGVTTAIWPHSALQVSPVPYGMHGLTPNGRLVVSFWCFSLIAVTPEKPSTPVNVPVVGLDYGHKPPTQYNKEENIKRFFWH